MTLAEIGARLRTQDNRMTDNPMFCVEEKQRDVGYDADYASRFCWHNFETGETVFDDAPGFVEPDEDGWEKHGYVDRWETVMVAFTEEGCLEYLRQNGHNYGETRIYVRSFNRCPEMLAIREALFNAKA